jgi:hypothetical protein
MGTPSVGGSGADLGSRREPPQHDTGMLCLLNRRSRQIAGDTTKRDHHGYLASLASAGRRERVAMTRQAEHEVRTAISDGRDLVPAAKTDNRIGVSEYHGAATLSGRVNTPHTQGWPVTNQTSPTPGKADPNHLLSAGAPPSQTYLPGPSHPESPLSTIRSQPRITKYSVIGSRGAGS